QHLRRVDQDEIVRTLSAMRDQQARQVRAPASDVDDGAPRCGKQRHFAHDVGEDLLLEPRAIAVRKADPFVLAQGAVACECTKGLEVELCEALDLVLLAHECTARTARRSEDTTRAISSSVSSGKQGMLRISPV